MIIRLGIKLSDTAYEERLSSFLAQKSGITVVKDPEAPVDLWLTDKETLQELQQSGNMQRERIVLMASEADAKEAGWSGERIEAYQPGSRLLRALKQLSEQQVQGHQQSPQIPPQEAALFREEGERFPNREHPVFTVYSPCGGCWKTSFAVTFAAQLSRCLPDKKVLFLNFEGISGWQLYFRNEKEYDLSDFLYCMLMEEPETAKADAYLEDMVVRQENGVYFIRPCLDPEDLDVLEEPEVAALFHYLKASFDVIVCDLNSAYHGVNRYILKESTRIYRLRRPDSESRSKLAMLDAAVLKDGSGIAFSEKNTVELRCGSGSRKDSETELPWEPEWFLEKDGRRQVRPGTGWERVVGGLAEEAVVSCRTS